VGFGIGGVVFPGDYIAVDRAYDDDDDDNNNNNA
jgi:hypothetical protein